MPTIQRLTTEQRDDLVAYLDGELDEAVAQSIEKILTHNPVARADVEMLTRTWELLDELPRASATEEFTQKTIASLQSMDVRQPLVRPQWIAKARRAALAAGWAVGLAAAAVGGFLLTNRAVPNPARELLVELPLIEKIDVYTEVQDIEFLRELRRSGLFQ